MLALSELQRKEWSVLKFIDDLYASLEEQLGEVRVGWAHGCAVWCMG